MLDWINKDTVCKSSYKTRSGHSGSFFLSFFSLPIFPLVFVTELGVANDIIHQDQEKFSNPCWSLLPGKLMTSCIVCCSTILMSSTDLPNAEPVPCTEGASKESARTFLHTLTDGNLFCNSTVLGWFHAAATVGPQHLSDLSVCHFVKTDFSVQNIVLPVLHGQFWRHVIINKQYM